MTPLTHRECDQELARVREENAQLRADVARLRLMNEGLVGRCAACAEVLCAVADRRAWVCPYCKREVNGLAYHESEEDCPRLGRAQVLGEAGQALPARLRLA